MRAASTAALRDESRKLKCVQLQGAPSVRTDTDEEATSYS